MAIGVRVWAFGWAVLAASALAAGEVRADASVQSRLEAKGLKYEIDAKGNYRVTLTYPQDGRSQLVFVSAGTEVVAGLRVREILAPAASLSGDGIEGERALALLRHSRLNKIGAWEVDGDLLLFVIKLPEDASADELVAAMDVAAETADDMEKTLSGDRDAL